MKTLKALFIIILLFAGVQSVTSQQKGYYRYPAIHGNDVIFTAEGDLWRFNLTKDAVRLTTNHGVESQASISPDGSWIAFVGQYEGPSEVYVMPIGGGTPKRLTYEEGSPAVYQWTTDGRILYSTNHLFNTPECPAGEDQSR